MFSSTLNERLKEYIYKNLRENAEKNLPPVINKVLKDIEEGDTERVKDIVRVIKFMLKDKLPAKPKFYSLILLKEMMETQDKSLLEYFGKKMLNRLFYLAQFESRNKDDLSRGERCLKKYYSQDSKENREYSLKFFILLLECWKHWDELFSADNKKIQQKAEKLRHLFPLNDLYYNYLDKTQPSDIESKKGMTFLNTNKDKELQSFNKSYDSQNHSLSESQYRTEEIQKKVLTFYQIREALFPVVRENEAEEIADILQDLYHSLRTQLELLQRHKNKVMQSQQYSEKFRIRFLRETDIADSIIRLFDQYYRREIDYSEFQRAIGELETEIQQKSLERFSQIGREDKGHFGTSNSMHDSMSMESSRRVFKSPETMLEPKSDKNMSKSMPSISNKISPRNSYNKQKQDDKYLIGLEKSQSVIREVKEEDEEDENFEDERWKALSDFKVSPNINKNSQFTFEDMKKASSELSSPEYDLETRNSGTNLETDFHDFNEKLVNDNFNNPNAMATIDEESKEDYESKVSFNRGPQDSRITNKGKSKQSKDQSFKQWNANDTKETPSDMKFDDFNDFGFKQNTSVTHDKDWLNFNSNSSQHKSSHIISLPKEEQKEKMNSYVKDISSNFKKQPAESKFHKTASFDVNKHSEPATFKLSSNKHIEQEASIANQLDEKATRNPSDFRKDKSSSNKNIPQKNLPTSDKSEFLNNYKSRSKRDVDKSTDIRKQSDDEYESFNHRINNSEEADPFSQFKIDNNISYENSEIRKNLENNLMTFGLQQFNDLNKANIIGPKIYRETSEVEENEKEDRISKDEEHIEDDRYEFQFDQNNNEEDDDNLVMPQFDKSMEQNLMKLQNFNDDQAFSDYSNERKPVEINKIKSQFHTPIVTKVVKAPTPVAREVILQEEPVDKFERLKLETEPDEMEQEITDLKVQKEHYRQQCDFLFSKILTLQKDKTKYRLNKTQDRSSDTLNVPDEDDLDIYQTKIINRKNEYLQKENEMLKRLNKDIVECNTLTVDKKDVENSLLKKLASEMEAYQTELQATLSKIIRI